MEEKSPRFSRKDGTHESSTVGPTSRKGSRISGSKKKMVNEEEEGGDLIECSGKYCGSCTGGLIADCVALCCCPCALVNLFALAFVKAPWMVGRKCFGKLKKRRRIKKEMKTKSNRASAEANNTVMMVEKLEEDGVFVDGFGHVSARFEAERVWLELYEDGHLGFGRVSFTGIQS